MSGPQTPAEVRCQLLRCGFTPLPLYGKAPVIEAWQKQNDTTEHEIEFWSRMHPAAQNTGILTRLTPTLDIDICDPYAAAAVERLVRDRFEDKGRILVRFGNAPKRCIPFQTIESFPKILRLLGDADTPVKDCERLEFLCDGQQVVVDGVHPDTGKPYSWFGGALGQIKHDDLPKISAEEAQALIDDAARLLVEEFGYRRKPPKPQGNGAGGGDWSFTPDDLIDHGQLTALAMRLLKSGMGAGAAVNFLRTAVAGVANVDEERRQRRLKMIPGMVSSAQAKLGLPPPPGLDPPAPPS
jgi:Bifunctional DNA primase/polymerase, N-terminal